MNQQSQSQPASDNIGFAEHWKRVGPQLEEIRAQEQAGMTQEQLWEAIDRVLDLELSISHRTPTDGAD